MAKDKKGKRPRTDAPMPEMQGEQTVVGEGKPTLEQSIQIVMDLAQENMIGVDPEPGMEAVAKRQEQAVTKVQRFLNRAYPLRRRIKEMAKDAGI